MKAIYAFLLCASCAKIASACPVEPAVQIAFAPDKYIEESDIVFFGKLEGLSTQSSNEQVAEFSVNRIGKGPDLANVTILNRLISSCSRPFQVIGSEFWVLALKRDDGEMYVIDIRGGFVPQEIAEEYGFDPGKDS